MDESGSHLHPLQAAVLPVLSTPTYGDGIVNSEVPLGMLGLFRNLVALGIGPCQLQEKAAARRCSKARQGTANICWL
jgi:hypothetical protein